MIDIDLDAIRSRDAKWYDRHPTQEGASRDRRRLLQYLDELELLVEELGTDVRLLRASMNKAKIPGSEQPGSQDAPNSAAAGKLPP